MRPVMSREERSAKNVKAVRTRKNMSQEQFAEAIGVATNTISRIETGAVLLSADVALRINKEFFVNMDYLFGFSSYEEGEPSCSMTCEKLIDAQSLIDIQDAMIKELNSRFEEIRKQLPDKKTIKLKKPSRSIC